MVAIRDYSPEFKVAHRVSRPVPELMNEDEFWCYDQLRELVTIYRGCDQSVLTGASWGIDQEVANAVPFTFRYEVPDPG